MREKEKEKDIVHTTRGHVLYSLGAIPSALPYNMVATFFVLFYVSQTPLTLGHAGLILLFYGIWNAINDPLIGYLMDKKATKWGRRVPYIVVGTVPFTFGFILLWWVPWTETTFSEREPGLKAFTPAARCAITLLFHLHHV